MRHSGMTDPSSSSVQQGRTEGNVATDCVKQRNVWPADRDGPRQQRNTAQG